MSPDRSLLAAIEAAVVRRLARQRVGPLTVGMCGAQGSGKSTLTKHLVEHLSTIGHEAVTLSLDDLYLSLEARETLAHDVHPLLRTRGVPGTHDTTLGNRLFDDLAKGLEIRLPRFDKALDDRAPPAAWSAPIANPEVVLFEGWCVGAHPQPDEALDEPVNALERQEDSTGVWRRHVNAALAGGGYRRLFSRIDFLILLAAPSFDVVAGWRVQQERSLRERTGRGMSDAEVEHFVQHFERLSQHILREMPRRADLVVRLRPDRSVVAIAGHQDAKPERNDL